MELQFIVFAARVLTTTSILPNKDVRGPAFPVYGELADVLRCQQKKPRCRHQPDSVQICVYSCMYIYTYLYDVRFSVFHDVFGGILNAESPFYSSAVFTMDTRIYVRKPLMINTITLCGQSVPTFRVHCVLFPHSPFSMDSPRQVARACNNGHTAPSVTQLQTSSFALSWRFLTFGTFSHVDNCINREHSLVCPCGSLSVHYIWVNDAQQNCGVLAGRPSMQQINKHAVLSIVFIKHHHMLINIGDQSPPSVIGYQ